MQQRPDMLCLGLLLAKMQDDLSFVSAFDSSVPSSRLAPQCCVKGRSTYRAGRPGIRDSHAANLEIVDFLAASLQDHISTYLDDSLPVAM
jgi:hypothetical protein